jgi:hypothetical protein
MSEHPSLKKPHMPATVDHEVETIAKEFLGQFQPIVESRRKLQETEVEVHTLIAALSQKIDALATLKKENLELERKTLENLNRVLNNY